MDTSCEVCGNHGLCFEVDFGGERHIFDSFECAMLAFAPRCANCGGELLGRGIVLADALYCSYPCAHQHTVQEHEQHLKLTDPATL